MISRGAVENKITAQLTVHAFDEACSGCNIRDNNTAENQATDDARLHSHPYPGHLCSWCGPAGMSLFAADSLCCSALPACPASSPLTGAWVRTTGSADRYSRRPYVDLLHQHTCWSSARAELTSSAAVMWLKSLREISSVNARKSTTKVVVISSIKGPKNQNRAADRRMPSDHTRRVQQQPRIKLG